MNPISVLSTKTRRPAAILALSGLMAGAAILTPQGTLFTPHANAKAVSVEPQLSANFADVVEAVSPAVVSVKVSGTKSRGGKFDRRSFGFEQLPEDHPLKRFFGDQFSQRDFKRDKKRTPRARPVSQGSGFFVSDDGYVVTNNHVVDGGSEYNVVMHDGTKHKAKLIGKDPKTDLAVLKVEAKQKFTYVSFSEKKSRVGEWVVAVGNPFGLGGTVTAGIVSAAGRDIGSGPYDDFIQIDAAVNKGNSGGPAFDLEGKVIGVNTAIFSPSGGNVGIAFAISAKSASEVVGELIEKGSVTRGWLGVQIQPVTKDIAESLGLNDASGALVADVQKDSPAEDAGLATGDVILRVDDEQIANPKSLSRLIASYNPKQDADLLVFRNGGKKSIAVKLGELPGQKKTLARLDQPGDSEPVDLEELGIALANSGEDVVITDVFDGSAAQEKGIRPGDRILAVNGTAVGDVNDVGKAVARAMEDDRKAVLFQIKSRDRNRFLALPIG